ncbi:transketolase [Kocuria sp. CPCC 205261]|uniref:transketolase n=1 Tax=Kocuria sp. CPCC 205261 TaxID=3073554 RepID=UPI0034D45D66
MRTQPADLDQAAVVTARLLALDAVENAGSGHPGTAIALAPVAHLLFQKHIRHDPRDPQWEGRDRFVLSCGHASILLYTQLFLTGYDLSLEDLRGFRSLGSRTPGHPEVHHTPGVETTTGPLGQGLAMAVGMAMAIKHDRALHDPDAVPGTSPFDRRVWVLASDGDLQEGISYEAGALAGRHQLDNLTVIYDDNDIQIDGNTAMTTAEDTAGRFAAQGWQVERVGLAPDGDVDVAALDAALSRPQEENRPRIVILKSQIAWPAPHAVNTPAAHGAPLGSTEASALREILGVTSGAFEVDEDALAYTRGAVERGAALHQEWDARAQQWAAAHPELDRQRRRATDRVLPEGLEQSLPRFEVGQSLATRDASGKTIQALAQVLPELWGGSADLAESNRTAIQGSGPFLPETTGVGDRQGRNVYWGVREHAMGAAMNGMALVGGSRVFAGTFFVFSDYQRPAIRLASLMQLPVVYLWTHDSLALGADGPTHQPIEHLAALRAIPGFSVVRPADAVEAAASWLVALERSGPVGLVLARQPVPVLDVPAAQVLAGVRRGAYVVVDTEDPDVIVIATGSEVALASAAAESASQHGIAVRVVSMPSREWFAEQDASYHNTVLPPHITARVVVEAATTFGWADIAGPAGEIVGVDEFGVSAPAEAAMAARGMTVERVLHAITTVHERVEANDRQQLGHVVRGA